MTLEYGNSFIKQAVLVVEDDPLLRMMAVDLVEDAGFRAVVAAGAEEAVGLLLTRTDIRVLFTDVDMPGGMDGVALACWVRDRGLLIGIVLTSGRQPIEDALPVRSFFFSKPYDIDMVTKALKRLAV